jgi:glutamate racemase
MSRRADGERPARGPSLLLIDWGIGGVGVLAALRRRAPALDAVYCSDSGHTPYGKVSPVELTHRLERLLAHFAGRGVTHAVLACNAASTVARRLRLPAGLRLFDVLDGGVRLVEQSGHRAIGLVGGARTIRSGAHRRRLAAAGISVRGRVAQPLSAFIERGELDSPALRSEVARVVRPLNGAPALLLACTHYPAIAPLFIEVLPGAALLDPADEVARGVLASLGARARFGRGATEAWTSGSPSATRHTARLAFGLDLGPVSALRLAVPAVPKDGG